jgi:hypothetical protein
MPVILMLVTLLLCAIIILAAAGVASSSVIAQQEEEETSLGEKGEDVASGIVSDVLDDSADHEGEQKMFVIILKRSSEIVYEDESPPHTTYY